MTLINPQSEIQPNIKERLRTYRKVAGIWAKELAEDQQVETLEGVVKARLGDYLCRGTDGEIWPQGKTKLLAKYDPTGVFDGEAWQRFDPKPNIPPVFAAQLEFSFSVDSHRGRLLGKERDFLVINSTNKNDIWIVDHKIFKMTYEPVSND